MTTRPASLLLRVCVGLTVCGLLAGTAAGCRSVRSDEALAMLDVSAATGMPSFTTARFSVAGRAEILPHEILYDGRAPLKFGYYLPGPNGTLRITGQALSASCLVGVGSAEVEVQLGHASSPVALVIAPVAGIDPSCLASADAGEGGDGPKDGATDLPHDAANESRTDARAGTDATATTDAKPDAKPDATPTPPPPPACMVATKACPGTADCCAGLVCGTTSLGHVCCGNFGMTCTRPGGEDCCGQLECVNGGCCLPATYACTGSSCCAGLVCGNTSLGHVCCGNTGAPCKRADGADCCGALRCVSNVCRP